MIAGKIETAEQTALHIGKLPGAVLSVKRLASLLD